jgi:glycosyltransferase involved in cell wall biosynthesis
MQNSSPRVTIVSPVYNAERFIERCIDSVLRQTYPHWEQIIVDDGSSDGTQQLIEQYHDPRIRYIRLPHRGLAALAESYNTAVNAARGDLIAILEGDDEFPPHKLELQVKAFDDPDVVLSWGRGPVVDDDSNLVRYWPLRREWRHDWDTADLFRQLVRKNILSPALTVMVRKSALDRIGGFRQSGSRLYVDLPTWLTITANVRGIAKYVDADLGLYRIHSTNTGKLHIAQLRLEHHEAVVEVMQQLGAERLRELRWTPEDERAELAASSLTRGVAMYLQGNYREARSAFKTTLRTSRSMRERINAVIGYVSAVTGADFIHGAHNVRNAADALVMKASMIQRRNG